MTLPTHQSLDAARTRGESLRRQMIAILEVVAPPESPQGEKHANG